MSLVSVSHLTSSLRSLLSILETLNLQLGHRALGAFETPRGCRVSVFFLQFWGNMWITIERWCHPYFIIELSWCLGVQSAEWSVNRRGWTNIPGGALVLSTTLEGVLPPVGSWICLWGSPISICRVWCSSPECDLYQSASQVSLFSGLSWRQQVDMTSSVYLLVLVRVPYVYMK